MSSFQHLLHRFFRMFIGCLFNIHHHIVNTFAVIGQSINPSYFESTWIAHEMPRIKVTLHFRGKDRLRFCESNGIACQRNIGGGTDASAIQKAKAGALSTTVGAPVRYMHSTVQLCHVDDIEATVELLKTFLEHAHEM